MSRADTRRDWLKRARVAAAAHPAIPVPAELLKVMREAQQAHIFRNMHSCVCGWYAGDELDWEEHRLAAVAGAMAVWLEERNYPYEAATQMAGDVRTISAVARELEAP